MIDHSDGREIIVKGKRVMSRRNHWYLLVSTCLTATGIILPAGAQQAAQPVQLAAADTGTTTIETVTVTARRTAENNQDVPIAVTALSGEALETKGVKTVQDLSITVPGLQVANSNQGPVSPNFTIRGQRETEALINFDPSVGYYFADVPVARTYGVIQSFYDIGSIQVLKGPQGTLFGRNTTGGAILVEPNKPNFDGFSGSITGLVGDFNLRGATGIVNIPLTDDFAVRIAGTVEYRDGYTLNLFNNQRLDDENTEAFRVSALWQPTEQIQSYTLFAYFNEHMAGSSGDLLRVNLASANLATGATKIAYAGITAQLAAQQARSPYIVDENFVGPLTAKTMDFSNNTSIDLGGGTLKNIVGWRHIDAFANEDEDGTIYNIYDQPNEGIHGYNQASDELQWVGKAFGDHLDYVMGAFVFFEEGSQAGDKIQNGTREKINADFVVNKSESVYAQGNYTVTDALTLTAGVRYTWDQRYANENSYNQGVAPGPGVGAPPPLPSGGSTTCLILSANSGGVPVSPCQKQVHAGFGSPTYLLTASYKITPDVMAYVTNNTGYRSGAINPRGTIPDSFIPVKPEHVMNYETGLKSEFLDHRLLVNAAVYYTDYTDIQRNLTVACPSNPLLLCSNYENAASAYMRGAELESTALVTDWLSLSGFLGYIESRYTKYIVPATSTTPFMDLSNSKFPEMPHMAVGGTATITKRLDGDLGELALAVTYYQQGMVTVQEGDVGTLPGYNLVNLNFTWSDVAGRPVDFRAYVNNLGNSVYYNGANSLLSSTGVEVGNVAPPRMVGVSVRYKF